MKIIILLKPKARTESGYRLYSDQDLILLQQIITLKFMRFSLEKIRRILGRPGFEVRKALTIQIEAVEDEIVRLRKASKALRQMAESLDCRGKFDWKKVIDIMEAIQMNDEAKKEWIKKFFTEADMKEFEEIGKKFTPGQMQNYQNKWTALIAEVQKNLSADPAGDVAQNLAKRWSQLLDEGYAGQEGLRKKIGRAYRESWKTGKFPTASAGKPPFDRNVWEFIQKASAARKAK